MLEVFELEVFEVEVEVCRFFEVELVVFLAVAGFFGVLPAS